MSERENQVYEIDVLKAKRDGEGFFTAAILADEEDESLNSIVAEAAAALGTPIALVTLLLERIQLFKAHYGLPADLAHSRATERNVSFCQFVVRDGQPFEVVDARTDDRIPQALVERYGIRSYLGMPLQVGDVVVGSLCVLDTKARGFSEDERTRLTHLASVVGARLTSLAEERMQHRKSLASQAASPGLLELRFSLEPILAGIEEMNMATATLRAFHRLVGFTQSGGDAPSGAIAGSFREAAKALEDLADATSEIEVNAEELIEGTDALSVLFQHGGSRPLSEILIAAQNLTRHPCRQVGGIPLPVQDVDPIVATPAPIVVGVLSAVINHLARQLATQDQTCGLRQSVHTTDLAVVVSITSEGLSRDAFQRVSDDLADQVPADPTMKLESYARGVRLTLATAR